MQKRARAGFSVLQIEQITRSSRAMRTPRCDGSGPAGGFHLRAPPGRSVEAVRSSPSARAAAPDEPEDHAADRDQDGSGRDGSDPMVRVDQPVHVALEEEAPDSPGGDPRGRADRIPREERRERHAESAGDDAGELASSVDEAPQRDDEPAAPAKRLLEAFEARARVAVEEPTSARSTEPPSDEGPTRRREESDEKQGDDPDPAFGCEQSSGD